MGGAVMHYFMSFVLALTVGVVGCSETWGTDGTHSDGGSGGVGDGGVGGSAHRGGSGGSAGGQAQIPSG